MRGLLGITVGAAIFGLGFFGGRSNERQNAVVAMQKTLQTAVTVANERDDMFERNSYLLNLFAQGQMSGQDLNKALEGEEEQFRFIPFFLGWGPITFGSIKATGDDIPCTIWLGENEYKCGNEGSRCGITVDIPRGPLKGKYMFTRPCDGTQISKRSALPGWDGYEIRYTTMTIIE